MPLPCFVLGKSGDMLSITVGCVSYAHRSADWAGSAPGKSSGEVSRSGHILSEPPGSLDSPAVGLAFAR